TTITSTAFRIREKRPKLSTVSGRTTLIRSGHSDALRTAISAVARSAASKLGSWMPGIRATAIQNTSATSAQRTSAPRAIPANRRAARITRSDTGPTHLASPALGEARGFGRRIHPIRVRFQRGCRSTVAPLQRKESQLRGAGRVVFAAILLLIAGIINIIYGIGAISDAHFYTSSGTHYVFGSLHTWGWVTLIIGIIMLTAGFSLMGGGTYGRVIGIVAATLGAIDALLA